MADDLEVRVVTLEALQEQDLNAQVMQPREFDRLTENVRQRGALESLPYIHELPDGSLEIVSGHHRVRAARAAGLATLAVLVDSRKMTRSEVVARQIAHNQLVGSPDDAILRQLATMLDTPDDLLTSGLPDEYLPLPGDDSTDLATPAPAMEWRNALLTFLPHQFGAWKALVESVELLGERLELVGAVPLELYEPFVAALAKVNRIREIRAVGTTVAVLVEAAAVMIAADPDAGADAGDSWVDVATILEPRMPVEAATVLRQAVDQMLERGEATQRWQAVEFMAANYLAGA